MKSPKDIETIIREGEKKLTIQPSAQAWQKLERRLDHRRPKNGTIVAMRQWMAVAATLLVLVVSLFMWNTNEKAGYDFVPTFVEELSNEAGCQPYCMVLEARKELPVFYAVPSKNDLKDRS
ncbi:MAG: hypothetical protein R2825_05270 [Saprospiraceae bacterium]